MAYLIATYLFFFGLIVGSFLNCLAWRLYKEESILGRSYCPNCRKRIAWYDNIPVISFIFLRGRCRQCKEKISWQYPLVELATGLLFLLVFLNLHLTGYQLLPVQGQAFYGYQDIARLFRDLFIVSVMVLIFIIDLRWYLIFDIVTLPASAIVLAVNLSLGTSWQELLISGIIGAGFFLVQYAISKGKWIGGGDIRLGLLMGLALGWPGVLAAILIAYFAGSIVGLVLIGFGKKEWGGMVPLGAFLAPASILVLFYGEQIVESYFRLIGL